MRRFFAFALAALLTLSAALPCFAEGEAGVPFERGTRWGMSREEVKALENLGEDANYSEYEEDVFSTLSVLDVEVSEYTAELGYLFVRDELLCINYQIIPPLDGADEPYENLRSELSALYGEPSGDDESAFLRFLNDIAKQMDQEEIDLAIENAAVWHLAGDTDVVLSVIQGMTSITYYNTAYDF
ncbi:MAG: hypothetical protein ACOYI8_05885 [Christensenellales bacterium]|jgi:hypothetical protein